MCCQLIARQGGPRIKSTAGQGRTKDNGVETQLPPQLVVQIGISRFENQNQIEFGSKQLANTIALRAKMCFDFILYLPIGDSLGIC